MSARFFVCDHCGNLITTLHDAGVPMLCCGEKLRELIPIVSILLSTFPCGRLVASASIPKL